MAQLFLLILNVPHYVYISHLGDNIESKRLFLDILITASHQTHFEVPPGVPMAGS